MTIVAVPDNVLLETFEFFLGKDSPDHIGNYKYDGWQILVHVCRTWRYIVLASPLRLDLKLYCTQKRSVNLGTLDIWPTLPIVVAANNVASKDDVTNIIAALRQHNRVCKIVYQHRQFQNSLLKEFAAIDQPFPALTSLGLSSFERNVTALPDSFLGGSAPQLRSLYLEGIPCPSIGKLLSSTTNLVRLSLWGIPHSGYISPKTIVPCLSTLSRLKSLELGFQYDRSRVRRTSRHPPPLTRVVFPNLTFLRFRGDIEYLEDILSQIETPMLNASYFCFFNQLVFDTPLLGHFIRRMETFVTVHTARVEFFRRAVMVKLLGREEDREALQLKISCEPLDWQLSAVAQVLNSFLTSLPTLESLEIAVYPNRWQGEIEDIQWREFLHPFAYVKKMSLEGEATIQLIVTALPELAGEEATEILPALRNLSLMTYDWQPSGLVKGAIEQFIAARQIYGRPATVQYQDTKSEE